MPRAIARQACKRTHTIFMLVCLLFPTALRVAAEEGEKRADPLAAVFDAIVAGKPILDVNFRWEYAKADTFQHSHAATVRTRLGYQTKTFYGFTGLAEMVNTASPKPSGYFDGVENNDGPQTLVADPDRTDVNRAWLKFAKEEWAGLDLKTGRQRIKLDDDRWIGNVGWRQNEQTYDAVRFQTSLGLENLVVQYIYAWQVNRIFADKGPANRQDYGPKSHWVNISYDVNEALEAVGFYYRVSPNDNTFAAQGSETFGTRLTGRVNVPGTEGLAALYQASYAYQRDAGRNQLDVDTHYLMGEVGLEAKKIGQIAIGYEELGSDQGAAVLATPFATAHKFNGFADVFLNNGGPRGLRDLYASVAPAIPLDGVKLKFIFHQFYDDTGGDNLGQEYDIVTTYQFNEYLSFLYKFGYFDGGKNRSPLNTTRSVLQTTFKF
jgi:hypothetical protein